MHGTPPSAKHEKWRKGNTVRHDYCAIRRLLEGVVWVISQTRNSATYTQTWATCRSGADFLVRIHPGSINRAEQYCPFRHFSWRAGGGGHCGIVRDVRAFFSLP